MERYEVKTTELHPAFDPEQEGLTTVYLASEVDAVLKRQAAAAINGMNAAKAISSAQLEQARRLRGESNPEALESERAANAILTERIAELECGIKGCVLPKHHHLLPDTHPHRWCSTVWITPYMESGHE